MTIAGRLLPSKDEADACEVARDMVLEGRLDEARALLEHAPNRLARECPACDSRPGEPCIDLQFGDDMTTLLVPHHARLVGHRDAGPLFGGRP